MEKIQPGEPVDSEKYISFDTALEENAGRFFYKFPKIIEYFDYLMVMHVHATGVEDAHDPEYIFSYDEYLTGIDPISLRYEYINTILKD